MYFVTYCAKDWILSMGHKRSIETIISKSSCFLDDKSFCPIFHRIIECDKTRETTNKSPQVFLTITVKFLGAFFRTQKVVGNTNL